MWCVSVDGFSFREDWNRVERSFLLFISVRNERILRRRRSLFRCRMRRRRNKVVLVSGSETKRERTTERRRRRRRPNRVVVLRATKENPMSETMSHHAIEFSSSLQKKHRILREKTTKRGRPSYHVNTKFTLSLSFLLFSSVQQEQQQRREPPN